MTAESLFIYIGYIPLLRGIAVTEHNLMLDESRPISVDEWRTKAGGEWTRVQYRMSDGAADFNGHPYIVAYLCKDPNEKNTTQFMHFYRWQSLSGIALFLGDEAGNDYCFRDQAQTAVFASWWHDSQGKWCERYHTGCPPERNIAAGHNSLSELISSIQQRQGK